MKKILFIKLAVLAGLTCYSQDKCSKFYPISENASFTSAVYANKIDAENNTSKLGEITYSVDEVLNNAALYTVTIKMSPMPPQKSQYKVTCTDDGVSIDTRAMAGGMMNRFANAEITGNNIYLPNELNVGDRLLDADMTITTSVAGNSLTMNRKRTNRKVTTQEDVTTPAGLFKNCYVLEYDVVMTVAGNVIMNNKHKEWLYPDIGLVQSQEFDADGNEMNFSWLISY